MRLICREIQYNNINTEHEESRVYYFEALLSYQQQLMNNIVP